MRTRVQGPRTHTKAPRLKAGTRDPPGQSSYWNLPYWQDLDLAERLCFLNKREEGSRRILDIKLEPPHARTPPCTGTHTCTHTHANMHKNTHYTQIWKWKREKEETLWDLYQAGTVTGKQSNFLSLSFETGFYLLCSPSWPQIRNPSASTSWQFYFFICICMFVCVSVCICVFVYFYVCVCLCVYVCLYVCVCACVWAHALHLTSLKLSD